MDGVNLDRNPANIRDLDRNIPYQPNQAASYFLLAVLSGILLSVSCLCGECIALKLAPPPPPIPPPHRHNTSESSDSARGGPDPEVSFMHVRLSPKAQLSPDGCVIFAFSQPSQIENKVTDNRVKLDRV